MKKKYFKPEIDYVDFKVEEITVNEIYGDVGGDIGTSATPEEWD